MGTSAYPLSGLLRIRDFRVDAAAKAVRTAEAALHEAQAMLAAAQAKLTAYRAWRIEETEHRYQSIMAQTLTLDELDDFKAGLAALADQELQKEAAVRDAQNTVTACCENLVTARTTWRSADHEREKILHHREEWQKGDAKESARQEDLEMEEFKPVLFTAGAEAEE
jgi:type III secretion protein O